MAALAHQKFNILAASVLDSMVGKKVLAAIVMTTRPDDLGTVVSIGTGSPSLTIIQYIEYKYRGMGLKFVSSSDDGIRDS